MDSSFFVAIMYWQALGLFSIASALFQASSRNLSITFISSLRSVFSLTSISIWLLRRLCVLDHFVSFLFKSSCKSAICCFKACISSRSFLSGNVLAAAVYFSKTLRSFCSFLVSSFLYSSIRASSLAFCCSKSAISFLVVDLDSGLTWIHFPSVNLILALVSKKGRILPSSQMEEEGLCACHT